MAAEDLRQGRGRTRSPAGGDELELTVPSLDEQTATPVERQRRTGPTGPLLPEIAAEIESRRQDFLTGLEEDLASMEEEELAASGSTRTAVAIPVAVPGSLPEVVTSAVPTQPLPALRPAVQAEGEAWPALDDRLLDLPPPAASPPFSEQSESADSSAEPLPPTVPARPFPPTLAGEGGGPPPRQGAAPGVGEGVPLLPFEWLEQPQAWRMGAVVAGRYRLAGTLGHGGMGEVLLAEDLLLRRKVALKALRRNLNAAKNVQALERFRQEVAMAHAVSHVGIARTFDMGETGGVSFLSMEYLDGETLASRLRREGPLPVAEVRRIGLEVASALDAAHQAGVIHRDLKPSNIQLTPDRGAVVLDFGLAAAIADRRGSRHGDGRSELLRPSSKSAGTPNYMAPEQWRGELQGVATDIYSFGCILFEATAGRLPFQGSTRATMMHAHLEEKPPSVRSLCSGVPRSLDQLITACLQKEIKDRPRTMFDVAQKLVELRLHHALVTAALALASLLLLLAGGVTIWKTSSHLLLREIRPAVKRLAMLAARDIAVADLDRVHDAGDLHSPAFQRVWKVLDEIRRQNPEIVYAYTLRKLEPQTMWEFVVDLDPLDKDENGDGVIEPSETGAPPGLRYDGSRFPWLYLTFLTDAPQADDRFEEDTWGIVLSGYAPVHGRTDDYYVVGMDVSNDPLLLLRNTIYFVFLVLGLLSAITVVLLRRRRALLLSGFGRVRVAR